MFWILFLHTEFQRYTREMIRMTYLIRGLDFCAWHEILKVPKFGTILKDRADGNPLTKIAGCDFCMEIYFTSTR